MKDIKYLKENGVNVEDAVKLFGDIEIYNETMKDFLDGINIKKERLENSKTTVDLKNYGVFAHSIKSDARYLGFTTVAEVALAHEMAGKENNQKFIDDNYNNLLEMVNSMIDIAKTYLEGSTEEEIEVLGDISNLKPIILVVDDSTLITELIRKTLENTYDLVIENSGINAKNILINKTHNVKALLLDLNMPDISGFEILDYLKENNLFSSINVSIITGDESQETIAKAFTYPIVDMLAKPFSVDKLNDVVIKTLNR